MNNKKIEILTIVILVILLISLSVGYIIIYKSKGSSEKPDIKDITASTYIEFVNKYKATMKDNIINSNEIFSNNNFIKESDRKIKSISITKEGRVTIYFYENSKYIKRYPTGCVLTGKYLFIKEVKINENEYNYFLVKEYGTITKINEFANTTDLEILDNYNEYTNITNIIDKYNECGSIDNYTCDDIDKDSIYFIDIKNKIY